MPRSLAWGFAGLLIFMIGDGVEAGYLSPYLLAHGFSGGSVALVFTVYGLTASVAAWFSGALSDLWGPRRVMWLGLSIWVVFQILFLAIALPSQSYGLILVSYAVRGLGYPLFAYGFLVWIAAATPQRRLGTAVGWFWFCFTAGLPTLGSLLASVLIPAIGQYPTLWFSLGLVAVGGLLALLLVREVHGGRRLAPSGERPFVTLLGSITILWRQPKIAGGALVRVINTAPQFGFLVFLPVYFTETVGFTLEEWLRLLTVMFTTNIVFNLIFGIVGDKVGWRQTVAWFGGFGSALTTLLLYYVPEAVGDVYLLSLLVAAFYGATLAGFVPLSALMPSLAPHHKGQAMSALNLGAGASTFVGPAIVGIFLGPLGVAGVMWIFAGLYVLSGIIALMLKLPAGSEGRGGGGDRPIGSLASLAGGSLLGHPVSLRTAAGDDEIDLILFDVGGTLYDDDCFAQALRAAVRELNPEVTDERFWSVYDSARERNEGSLRTAIAEAFVDGRRTDLVAAIKRNWHYPETALYPDVKPTLSALGQRYRLGIVANSGASVLDALRRDGLDEVFTVIALAEQVGVEKPDRAIFDHALNLAGVPASRALYVGNRLDTDVRPAQNCGMRSVWTLRGEAPPAPTGGQLSEPDAVITSLTGLPAVLGRFAGATSIERSK
ncbi:RbtT/DalT/CsbX family MFS transporter [Amycolatopsis sp. NPDC058340]|uniref:RbtT/DalT/CsbX family MFS transporter n=1 Tax=Amycolatopsis sp. NPDC058340 TaxID=3346453 RepID=UPI0036693DC7